MHPACPMHYVRIPSGATNAIVTLDCMLVMAIKLEPVASCHLGYIFFSQVNYSNHSTYIIDAYNKFPTFIFMNDSCG